MSAALRLTLPARVTWRTAPREREALLARVSLACERELGVKPYATQLRAARVLLDGRLAEMATGEGKTLAAALAAAAAALSGRAVHVITANDYLVARDHALAAPLFAALGLRSGAVTQPMDMAARRAAYACDITYCTAKELVFDYLRDGLAGPRLSPLEQSAAALTALAEPARRQPLLRELDMAIIDEADSILIDEARVPLVLSRAGPDAAHERLRAAWVLAGALEHGTDFVTDEMARGAHLTACGRAKLEAADTARDLWLTRSHREETVVLALTARHLLHEGRDYVVHDGRVAIVDATTGRKALGRAWSQGLQQLVELKAGCALSPLLSTVAQITYQRFFPRYRTLAGMSGTLREARRELACVYRVRVSRVPLRVPGRRVAHVPRVFADTDAMWRAAAEFAAQARREGRPLLIGTDSVAASEALSRRLAAHGLAHDVLNALQDRHEAEVIARAGRAGAITVATNMAGRGTDIVLDDAARAAGGLHVLCCQQNSERRIDRQLMGRCARQGDPGSHAQWLALDGAMLASAPLSTVIEKVFKNKNLRYYLGWVCKLRLQFAQRLAERRARRERAALLRRDERLSEALAFGGSED